MSRELEKKFVVEGATSQLEVEAAVRKTFPSTHPTRGGDFDVYWESVNVDSIRLRKNNEGDAELTVKKTDRGTIEDRLEVTHYLGDCEYRNTYDIQTLIHGAPKGFVNKLYAKFHLHTLVEVSVYVVMGDSEKRIFLEVEGPDYSSIAAACSALKQTELKLTPQTKSIYQLFIKKD